MWAFCARRLARATRSSTGIVGAILPLWVSDCMLPVIVLLLAFSLALEGQGPLLPTLARLEALKLASIKGDVPVRYSRGASRDVASALAGRTAECRGLLAATGRPSIVLALLDRSDWERVSDRPYGMPHHSAADSPYIIVIPQNWRDAAPMFMGVRTYLAGALGEHGVDRYVHLAALHEVGHLLTDAALETTTEAIRTRFPFWYGEFLANYFADACLAPQAEESAFRRRGAAALAAIPRQRFTTLDDADRLLTERDPSGPPVRHDQSRRYELRAVPRVYESNGESTARRRARNDTHR